MERQSRIRSLDPTKPNRWYDPTTAEMCRDDGVILSILTVTQYMELPHPRPVGHNTDLYYLEKMNSWTYAGSLPVKTQFSEGDLTFWAMHPDNHTVRICVISLDLVNPEWGEVTP